MATALAAEANVFFSAVGMPQNLPDGDGGPDSASRSAPTQHRTALLPSELRLRFRFRLKPTKQEMGGAIWFSDMAMRLVSLVISSRALIVRDSQTTRTSFTQSDLVFFSRASVSWLRVPR
jgi:hypothetical protein